MGGREEMPKENKTPTLVVGNIFTENLMKNKKCVPEVWKQREREKPPGDSLAECGNTFLPHGCQ